MKLTTTECRNAQPKEKAYRLTDGRGLSLLIQPTGSKLWQWGYRHDGKSATKSLGRFPEVSVQDARKAVTQARVELKLPAVVEVEEAPQMTFAAVAREHLDVWKVGKVEAHVQRVWGRLVADALPDLGDRLLGDIKPADVVAVVRKVEARGALDVSRRLKQKVSEIFGYAVAMGYCDTDPAQHINRVLTAKPKTESMAKIPLSEVPALVVAIGTHPIELVRIGLQFAMLTATRTNEVREARWSEIDGDLWKIPASRMKMRRDHIVPLAPQTLELLEKLRKHRRSDYLFPGVRRPLVNKNWMIYGLYDIAQGSYRGRQTVHGFRGLFSTTLNEAGFNRDWIERQLAHVEESAVRGAYNSAEYMEGRVSMMRWWADRIDEWRLEGVLE
jgi:integrase